MNNTNERTPAQEALISAQIAHVDFLLQARRAAQTMDAHKDALHMAVVAAALAIIAEPKGQSAQRRDYFGRPILTVASFPDTKQAVFTDADLAARVVRS